MVELVNFSQIQENNKVLANHILLHFLQMAKEIGEDRLLKVQA